MKRTISISLIITLILCLIPITYYVIAEDSLVKLQGTQFGTSPSYNNSTAWSYDKATDGNTTTYFDYSAADGGYTGIDLGLGNERQILKIRFYPRASWEGRMVGGKFQGSNTSTSSGFVDLYTVPSTPTANTWTEVTISSGTAYRYLRYLSPNGGFCNVAEVEFYSNDSTPPPPTEAKLTGTQFGTSPSYNNSTAWSYDKATDGNTTTYFDCSVADGGYTGIDLGSGNGKQITKIRFYPRASWEGRMVGGKFQGSNTSTSSGYTDLYTVPSTPTTNTWTEVTISNGTAYRYLRYLSPNGGFCNVAEIEFYTGDVILSSPLPSPTPTPSPIPTPTPTPSPGSLTKLSGTQFGTSPAYLNSTAWSYDKATDGNTTTYFDYSVADGGYTGIDLGSGNGKQITKIRFYPRASWEGRMVGGKFQGSNTSTSNGYTDLYTVPSTPTTNTWTEVTISNGTAYRYLRYLSPNGGFCNVAEIEFYTGSGSTPTPSPYGWVNPSDYTANKISVVQPTYTSTINGNTEVVICAPGLTQVIAKCWKQGSGYGSDSTVATVNLDSRGVGGFIFPASEYPHGPINIRLTGYTGTVTDECNLQLYNTAGVSWNEGLSSAPVPPQISGLGLSVVYQDDFTNSDLSIARNDSSKKYCSHKPGYQDFSGIAFTDYESTNNPFSQVGTYMRIRADQNLNSTGLISSCHQDYTGFGVKAPAYFECKFIAPNAKGTWPAFWTLTNTQRSQFTNGKCDELDVIEAYGFDSSQSQLAGLNWYQSSRHNWNSTPDLGAGQTVIMTNLGGGGMWYYGFHTYGLLVTTTDTVFYCDNVEVWRYPTMTVSAADYNYFLINLAIGGISGWPYDLSRYNGKVDMYVDWVRAYGLSQNVQ